jgi:hypothetical protein
MDADGDSRAMIFLRERTTGNFGGGESNIRQFVGSNQVQIIDLDVAARNRSRLAGDRAELEKFRKHFDKPEEHKLEGIVGFRQ